MLKKIRIFVLFTAIVFSFCFSASVVNAAFYDILLRAVDDFYKVAPGATLSVPAPGILSNDISPSGLPLTATATSLYSGDPNSGTMLVNADGSFTYSAKPGARGFVTYRYRVNDGMYNSDYYGYVVIDIVYRVIFHSNGGTYWPDMYVYHNDKLNNPILFAPHRDGYTFAGWYTDTTYAVPYNFNLPVTSNFSLEAKWTYNSGGSGGVRGPASSSNPVVPPTSSVPSAAGMPEVPVSINATFGSNNAISTLLPALFNPSTQAITARLDPSAAQNLIDKALWAKAAKQSAIARIQFGSVANASAVNIILPSEGFKKMASEKLTLQLNSSIGAITLGPTELTSIARSSSSGNISVGIKKLGKENLTPSAQAKVKNSPVYRFDFAVGNTQISKITGSIKITLPYAPKAGESKKTITVYYSNSRGLLRSAKAAYDSKTGTISFALSRF